MWEMERRICYWSRDSESMGGVISDKKVKKELNYIDFCSLR